MLLGDELLRRDQVEKLKGTTFDFAEFPRRSEVLEPEIVRSHDRGLRDPASAKYKPPPCAYAGGAR